ncbi:polyphosphate kinase 2 family protein [Pusillimonas sp. CC-YST705]|uniref:Polyphosphate kinase 2 family protein n=1 Tax=Mesopusillimonas faecipullorum TaxID=2755040 RepID=A0ABS8CAN3_9BURK|nr:PPK2 family polyphosphate kinase [Mesopusillimonas faecipullorum]MCB5363085.1 polyphosphate kinase 2 family protein [Mesopusillimonas faecipullorum]
MAKTNSTPGIIGSNYLLPHVDRGNIAQWPSSTELFYKNKRDYEEQLAAYGERLSNRQEMLFAGSQQALLLVFQAMDAAGKDSTIKATLTGINPQGCDVTSFRAPSERDLSHDFLWKAQRHLPSRGMMAVFNRSYYEDVLVVRVHPEFLEGAGMGHRMNDLSALWRERYASIVDFEGHLTRNNTRVVKFFLNVSPEEQRKRLIARLDDPTKHWKFDPSDVAERGHWDDYMQAYQDCLGATHTENSPWYVIPADDKENMRLIVAQILQETLDSMSLNYPKPALDFEVQSQVWRKALGDKPKDKEKGKNGKNGKNTD